MKLANNILLQEWFVITIAVALVNNGQATEAWEEKAPDFMSK